MKIGTQRSLKNSNDLYIFIHDHRLKEVTIKLYISWCLRRQYLGLERASFIYAKKNVSKNPCYKQTFQFPDWKRSIEDL